MVQLLMHDDMYYTFCLVSQVRQERGIVGYRELPDLFHDFCSLAKEHGAISSYLEDGSLIATKGTFSITLSIGVVEEAFPCRRLAACMTEFMAMTFGR